jgi:pyruvate formate-lyase activating enzyme-like uncharacterized protein
MRTKFDSFCLNGIPTGCKYCVKGRKLVLFISGKCSRNCWYCSLSEKRKNKDIIWANERECRNIKEVIQEARESQATSAGITGGDPLLCLNKTTKFALALKRKFGKNFHIHIYLPTKLLTKERLKKLKCCIDEVRFHPEFLARNLTEEETEKDTLKIKLACLFWKRENIGIELPILPDRKREILDFIIKVKGFVGFVNLNELELSETNFEYLSKKYKLKENGYIAAGSKEAGLWILDKLKKEKLKLKVHLCTAELKNWHQYKNRLLKHNTLPYGYRTEDGTVEYFAIYCKDADELKKISKKLKSSKIYLDKNKKRLILSEESAEKLAGEHKIALVEEYPTYDQIEVEREEIRWKE